MKETTSQQFSSASPTYFSPGSLNDVPFAEASDCGELTLEENKDMEVKQLTLHKRSGEVKQHSKKDGVLTAEVVSSCMSNLGRVGTGLQHLYHQLSLPSHDLSDISVLCNYVHLQKLELPHNKIKDLSCVSHMPYLVILDASHNDISSFFGFQPPKNLKEVNFSHNCITKMKDLSAFSSLSHLDLGYNCLSEISGLEQCCKLTHLSLAHNRLSRISGLDSPVLLTHLCLRGNQLKRIEGLENLKSLQVLDLSLNHIASLSGLQNLRQLGSINLEKNLISEVQECKHIHDLFLLRDLNLLGNSIQEQPDYRLAVIFLLQHLTVLDQAEVTAEEKVASVNKYDPPLDVLAARDHMTHLVYQLMQPQVLYESTMPNADSPYPMLVLTGPPGCGKRELAHRLCQELSDYFAISHTTRGPYSREVHGIDYHFINEEDFQSMIKMGKFIQTMQYGGHSYGLTRDAIEDVAREGLACCVHMELEGVFSLKNTYFEPRYILLIPIQVEKYMDHLKSHGLYTPAQIDMAKSRIELYANTNRQRLGFFDNVIPCDDWDKAYQTLRQVVKEYLLLDEEGENNHRGSLDNSSTGNEPEEKLASPPLPRSGSSTLASLSATALDPSDPSYRNYFTKIHEELSPQKSPAELASIRRREQLVREAVVGKSPGVYSQLFKSSAQTAPSSLQKPNTHLSEDNSNSDESRASSATGLSGSVEPFDMSVQGHTLEALKGQTPEAHFPGTDQLAVAVSPSSDRRPGSDIKPILPPIPAGRKTPASPSPAPSP
ncbi:leucine-rich repeat and guanylate kinase domain-containing protein isoform X4 [Etheostoma cragini]|uniref:leucine-rich repeat and guanylate kinase domain-containing protein isoform X4 n=1 Tax=Etheostoma cragini TaxID=417921 RepID=UPI00155DF5EA|nr:leucine-rich repeat and guanylate kinase domain-containing protein isoform X4 [Etheostoma cragini]